MTEALRARLDGADLLFFDGTTYEDDEMIRLGLSHKTAWRMGHMAMNGERGSIAALDGVRVGRKIFIHINNSNPVLCSAQPERDRVEAAGWEVAHDGLEHRTRAVRVIADERPAAAAARRSAARGQGARALGAARAGADREGQSDRRRDPETVRRLARARPRSSPASPSASTPIPRASHLTCARCWPRWPRKGWPSYDRSRRRPKASSPNSRTGVPLACPYCSNPINLDAPRDEMSTQEWKRIFSEAAELGVLHLHLSGGEPCSRRDLAELVEHAARSRALHQSHHLGRRPDARVV